MRTRPTVIAVAQTISQYLVSYPISKLAFVFWWSLCEWAQDAFGCSDGTGQDQTESLTEDAASENFSSSSNATLPIRTEDRRPSLVANNLPSY